MTDVLLTLLRSLSSIVKTRTCPYHKLHVSEG